jgi:hypothetical protein
MLCGPHMHISNTIKGLLIGAAADITDFTVDTILFVLRVCGACPNNFSLIEK